MTGTAKTSTKYGDPNALLEQAAGLFGLCQGRNSVINRLTGKMPTGETDAMSKTKGQSKTEMPIVQAKDLGRGKGDEVKFHFVQPANAFPIMGSEYAEGKGTGIKIGSDQLRVNQARFPIDLGDVMSQIRSPYDLRRLGRPLAKRFMDAYVDQSILVHMAGARGNHYNNEWCLPVESHPKFADMLVNRVKAPTKNRHFIADGDAITGFTANAGELSITTADFLTMDTVDAIATHVDQIELPPPPVKFEGDEAADDSPIRVLLCSPAQYNKFAKDPQFRSMQASALARASNAKQHPIFKVDAGLWSNTLIIKMPKPIRFYAGDTIKYCAAYDTEVESSCIVPASFGTGFAVDRALLLGGQALAQAWAASEHSGMPFFWKEKDMDHGDKLELLIGAVLGMSKIRWGVEATNGLEYTDHGVIAIDTTVPIIGARK
ncbi:MAG TPA: N4-gp56 family major capsid protein [Pseudomonas sp.]